MWCGVRAGLRPLQEVFLHSSSVRLGAGLFHELLFPRQRRLDNATKVVVTRRPIQHFPDLIRLGGKDGWITGSSVLFADVQDSPADLLNHSEHFTNAISVAVTAVEGDRQATVF